MPKPPSDVPNRQVTPPPALEKRTRRRFSTAEKLRILDEADGCARGELGALLRREKLYSSQLQQWRRERAEQGVPGKTEPGPAASKPPHQRRIEQLEQENVRLVRQLTITQACIDLQKNVTAVRSREQWAWCMNQVVHQPPEGIPLATACIALGLNRSSVYARRRAGGISEEERAQRRSRLTAPQPRALSAAERQALRELLYSLTYRDQPPAEIHADLLEHGQAPASLNTLYRLLRADQATGERRAQRPAQHHAMPRLVATAANQVWTWDITQLPTIQRGPYRSLYVVLDLYSRYALAWMVSRQENSALAQYVMQEAIARYAVAYGPLTLHQDRGAPMMAHTYLDLMAELGVTCSHSQPRVSNDNPVSESPFKTLKYQPDDPGRFQNVGHARQWCEDYFQWYNHVHHHRGLAYFTPEQVFTGRDRLIARTRQAALDRQYQRHPERFVKGPPRTTLPPEQMSINPVAPDEAGTPRNQAP